MINPLSGGGIVNAMKSGRLAAHTAGGTRSTVATPAAAALADLSHEWMRLLGDDHVRFYQVKEALARFDDVFYDNWRAP
jgi:flavin-dependent dehydrogenase